MKRLLVALALLAAMSRPADAHQSSVTYTEVFVRGAEVDVQIQFDPADLVELDEDPADYAIQRVAVFDRDRRCDHQNATVSGEDGEFYEVRWTARCPAEVSLLAIEYDLFYELDPLHESILRVHAHGDTADTVLRDGSSRFVWEIGEPPPSGVGAFLVSGIDHILEGYDHIAFVLTLLLVVMLFRGDDWKQKTLPQSLRATALIVTAFTVAHTITLISASLGWVSVPSRIVEPTIAATIAYTAVENIIRPDVRWRYVVTFGFGLAHGLGFASVLSAKLPPDDVVVPLLTFNVGVELGQLIVVCSALPLLWLLCRVVGARSYRRIAMPILSSVSAVLALVWFVERVFDITLLGL